MTDYLKDLLGGDGPGVELEHSVSEKRKKAKIDPLSEHGKKLKAHKVELYEDALGDQELAPDTLPLASDFARPVSAVFLGQIFGKPAKQISARLTNCRVIGHRPWGQGVIPQYDFLEAISYLLEPKGSFDDWFATKNPASLPSYVTKAFWDSANQRNRVMRGSNDLWHTEDVLSVLGRVALTIKEESRLWIEELPGRDQLSDEQYKHLLEQVTVLQNNIRDRMLQMPSDTQTSPMSITLRDELDDAGRLPDTQKD